MVKTVQYQTRDLFETFLIVIGTIGILAGITGIVLLLYKIIIG